LTQSASMAAEKLALIRLPRLKPRPRHSGNAVLKVSGVGGGVTGGLARLSGSCSTETGVSLFGRNDGGAGEFFGASVLLTVLPFCPGQYSAGHCFAYWW
jgi:hypothetical protein